MKLNDSFPMDNLEKSVKKWVKVFSDQAFYKVEIVRATLVERGVEAVIMDKVFSSYNIGEREVYVEKYNFEKAKLIIQQDVDFE